MKTAKNMEKVYLNTSTVDLIRNKGKKQCQLLKIQKMRGYWANKERARLNHMIQQIDAVIESRALQKPLF